MNEFMSRREFHRAGLAVASVAALGANGIARAAPAPDTTEEELEKLAEKLSNWGPVGGRTTSVGH